MATFSGNKAEIALMLNGLEGMAKDRTPLQVNHFTFLEGENRPEEVGITWGMFRLFIDYTQQTAQLRSGDILISWGGFGNDYKQASPPGQFVNHKVLDYVVNGIREATKTAVSNGSRFETQPLFSKPLTHARHNDIRDGEQYPPYPQLGEHLHRLSYYSPTTSARPINEAYNHLSLDRVALGVYKIKIDYDGVPSLELQTTYLHGNPGAFGLIRSEQSYRLEDGPSEWMTVSSIINPDVPGRIASVSYTALTEIPVGENQALLRLPDPVGLSWLAWKPVRYESNQGAFAPTR